jgi:hypothetical protein
MIKTTKPIVDWGEIFVVTAIKKPFQVIEMV